MTTPTDNYLSLVPADKTSLTDDERIENIVPLPPPEHLIRFFPIQGTPAEKLIADTSCGYGCVALLPEGAKGFTTIELKSNFLGTAREGAIYCRATPVHLGRTTQVWDAVVTIEGTEKKIALFRCTQMVLWPK